MLAWPNLSDWKSHKFTILFVCLNSYRLMHANVCTCSRVKIVVIDAIGWLWTIGWQETKFKRNYTNTQVRKTQITINYINLYM